MRTLLFILTLLLAAPVQARMYQWVSPSTGITQLSGKPPSWYRSGRPGPRVFVFDNGRIIDDTAIKVTEAEREDLRDQAFKKADALARAGSSTPAAKPASAAPPAGPSTKAEAEAQKALGQAAEADAEPSAPETGAEVAAAAGDTNNASTQSTIERLKAIIAQWDQKQTEHAKNVLNTESQLKQLLKKNPPAADTGP